MTSWSKTKSETAKAMWIAGRSARDIADLCGVTRNAVIGRANREGWPRHWNAPVPAYNDEFKAQVIEEAKSKSFNAVARELGVDRMTVSRWVWADIERASP